MIRRLAVMLPRKLNVTVTEPFESRVDPSISENRNLHSAFGNLGHTQTPFEEENSAAFAPQWAW